MGSRIRENVKHFFECFCEVVPPTGNAEPWIIQQFPEKYKDEEVLKSVPKFAYPYKFQNEVIQHYSFVLTDVESKWTFGFCRHDPKSETAIVVLSYLPWHQGFYKFLDTTAVLMHSSRTEDLREFLSAVYNAKIAEPGKKFVVSFNRGESIFSVDVPRPFQLPSIPENRNLTEYFNAVDTQNMMIVFASMLYERRIIFTSKKLKRLSACVQSANDIIYPMIWQHIFIPILPMSLIDYLLAPMPFLIGVPQEVFKTVRRSEIGDVVILDADANTVETPFDDLNNLPQEVVSLLRKQLKNKSLGDGVSRAFLRALVQLIGGYRDALKFQPGQQVSFDEEKFIETRPISLQPFLREMLHLQIFQQSSGHRLLIVLSSFEKIGRVHDLELKNELSQNTSQCDDHITFTFSSVHNFQKELILDLLDSFYNHTKKFIEERLMMLNTGQGFSDEFEFELENYSAKSGSKLKQQYKEWTSTMKKEGTAFFRSVKDKANPAMKSAVKTVKDGGKGVKSAYKGLRSKLKENPNTTLEDSKHRSAPSSPTSGKRRTIASAFGAPVASYRKDAALTFKNSQMQRSYSPLTPGSQSMSPDALDSSRSASPIEIPRIDLMNEMEDLLHLRLEDTPPVDRSLKPVRSLENFKNTSPLNSPEHWQFQSRSSAPIASPSNRFFLQNLGHSQETQNLLQSPEDVFLSPPVPPRAPPPRDLFADQPFIVGGGTSENGDPLFYVANHNSVDIVKLSPPVFSPRRKQNQDTEDLIRLDSTSDIDDFDPLKSSPSKQSTTSDIPLSLSNPLYTYENHSIKNGGISNLQYNRNDQALLQEYGLDFSFSNSQNQNFDPFNNMTKVSMQGQWTKFE